MATQHEATLRLYEALNSPAKAGKVWVQYERKVIDAALDVLKQIMTAQGYEFRPHSMTYFVPDHECKQGKCANETTGCRGECQYDKLFGGVKIETPNVEFRGATPIGGASPATKG